jgi:hypothetical protein
VQFNYSAALRASRPRSCDYTTRSLLGPAAHAVFTTVDEQLHMRTQVWICHSKSRNSRMNGSLVQSKSRPVPCTALSSWNKCPLASQPRSLAGALPLYHAAPLSKMPRAFLHGRHPTNDISTWTQTTSHCFLVQSQSSCHAIESKTSRWRPHRAHEENHTIITMSPNTRFSRFPHESQPSPTRTRWTDYWRNPLKIS